MTMFPPIIVLLTVAAGPVQDTPPVRDREVVDQALRMAELIEPVPDRVAILAEVARAQARLGLRDEAKATFRLASRTLDGQPVSESIHRLKIARAQALVGMADEAREERRRLLELGPIRRGPDAPVPSYRVLEMARALAAGGDLETARELAAALPEPVTMERLELAASYAIGAAYKGLGDEANREVAAAEAALEELRNGPNGAGTTEGNLRDGIAVAHLAIAEADAKAGRRDEARRHLERVTELGHLTNPNLAPERLARTSIVRRSVGDEAGADADVDRIVGIAASYSTPGQGAQALARSALWLDRGDAHDRDHARDFRAKARALAEAIDPAASPLAVVLLADTYTALGDWAKALEFGRDPKVRITARVNILRALARAQAKAGDPSVVLDWVEAETEPLSRSGALLGLAEGLAGRPASP